MNSNMIFLMVFTALLGATVYTASYLVNKEYKKKQEQKKRQSNTLLWPLALQFFYPKREKTMSASMMMLWGMTIGMALIVGAVHLMIRAEEKSQLKGTRGNKGNQQ